MTRFILATLFITGLTFAGKAHNVDQGTLKVNATDSKVEWTARKVTGKHTGTVKIKNGQVEINDGILTKATVTMDMTSIANSDLSGQYKTKLEGHLRSDDFFFFYKFPTASLKTTTVVAKSEGDYRITADLTIRGITHPITFDAQVVPDGNKYRAMANLVVDRTLYDVKYGSGKFFDDLGDTTIYDDFDLAISLVIE